jgi:tetratricopeptide (TPR) repeat protein
MARDPLYPVIVRATALSFLNAYPGNDSTEAFKIALMDDEALIRRTAIDRLNLADNELLVGMISPLLYDPVKAVRMEAAQRLAGEPANLLTPEQHKVFQSVLHEFETSMEYSADFAFGRYNLGNLYTALNRPQKAIRNYKAAIHIDDLFYAAKVNLAMLYNQRGDNDRAEVLLREVVEAFPEVYEAAYSLGLLLAEKKQYPEAAVFLRKAAQGLPERHRIQYNLGLLLQHLKRDNEAETALLKTLDLEPDSIDYLYALADHYIKRGQWEKAKSMANQMVAKHPDHRMGHELLEAIKQHPQGERDSQIATPGANGLPFLRSLCGNNLLTKGYEFCTTALAWSTTGVFESSQ